VLKTVARIFGKQKKGVPSEEPRFDSQGYSNFNLYLLPDSRPQITFSLSFPAFGRDEADRLQRMRLGVINYVLGKGSGSRLFQRLRQKEGFVYGVGSGLTIYRSLGALEISSSTAVEKLRPSLKAVKEEIEKLKAEGISQEEFSLANHFLDSNTLLRFDNPESITYSPYAAS
jgi:predicted Zn-dependent peptidase